ncbi:chloride channel protein [Nocardia terpenica]|nr:chloride channel protein [Nocardia terpenica]MBF6116382.1 chloride channel protein [Nocardia terpenica]MBF6123539.1 chloride channel protein [Nocardia terpenica]MBF6156816.1 chloride channel protein [Nocardia terpenica]
MLQTVSVDAVAATLPAALAAAAVSRLLIGDGRLFRVPDVPVTGAREYLLYAVTGVVAGLAGIVFSTTLCHTVRGCDTVWRDRPAWARPILGGVLLGVLLLALPPLYGVGVPVVVAGVDGRYTLAVLLVLLAGKILATSLTFGIGGYGGVFMPTLFVGAMSGSALGTVVHQVFPGLAGAPIHCGLIGMSAAFIAATRAPVTGIVMLLELTGDYDMAVPLMVAAVPALLVGGLRSGESPYVGTLLRQVPGVERPRAGASVAVSSEPF